MRAWQVKNEVTIRSLAEAVFLYFLLPSFALAFLIPLGNGKVQRDEPATIRANITRKSAQKIRLLTQSPQKNSVGLGFRQIGKLEKYIVGVGDKVTKGQPLAELDKTDVLGQIRQLEAGLSTQPSLSGSTTSSVTADVVRSEIKLEKAKIALENERGNWFYTIFDAYTRAEDAVRSKVGQFILDPRSLRPRFNFSIFDNKLQDDFSLQQFAMELLLNSWKTSFEGFTASGDLAAYNRSAKENLNQVNGLLETAAKALSMIPPDTLTPSITTLRNWRADVYTARSNLNTGLKNLVSAETRYKEAEYDVKLQQYEFGLKKESPDAVGALQESRDADLKSKINLLKSQIGTMTLVSPLNGTVTSEPIAAGSSIIPSSPVIFIHRE